MYPHEWEHWESLKYWCPQAKATSSTLCRRLGLYARMVNFSKEDGHTTAEGDGETKQMKRNHGMCVYVQTVLKPCYRSCQLASSHASGDHISRWSGASSKKLCATLTQKVDFPTSTICFSNISFNTRLRFVCFGTPPPFLVFILVVFRHLHPHILTSLFTTQTRHLPSISFSVSHNYFLFP